MLVSKKLVQSELFNDGVAAVLWAKDGVVLSTIFDSIHYGNRTYGVRRFFDAKVTGNMIEKMISIPLDINVKRENILELKEFKTGNTLLFEIVMIQEKYDTAPPSQYITLKKAGICYDDHRNS